MSKIVMVTVDGMIAKDLRLSYAPIEVRVSNDEHGKSISLANGDIMLMIPFEPVEDLLRS